MRSHLTPEEFIDAAESRRVFAHLDACAECRRQVVQLREMIAAAADVETPEPSPLFWDHFSDRVRAAVRTEEIAPRSWWRPVLPFPAFPGRLALGAAAFIVVVLLTAISLRSPVRQEVSQQPGDTAAATAAPTAGETSTRAEEEAALQLIADLSSDLDWDAASEAGLLPSAGWIDTVLSELSEGERAALEQLLHEEISRSGA
jgi:anti-sigma factor RsiW